MVTQSALGGTTRNAHCTVSSGLGGEQSGRRGGLSVYYQTQGREESVKGEATDLVAIVPLEEDQAPAVSHPVDGPAALRFGLSVKILTSYRDAHLYVFPYWIKDLARHQEKLESVSEDLIGYWAKAEWQKGLGEKLGVAKILRQENDSQDESRSHDGDSLEDEIDLQSMSTTKVGSSIYEVDRSLEVNESSAPVYASRVQSSAGAETSKPTEVQVPQILAYVQRGSAPFVRRVDSSAILLSTSLRLAKLESIEEVGRQAASPFAHNQKIAPSAEVAQRCTITKSDCLLGENVTVEPTCVIKESVIGSNCHISSGARLTRCVLMDGVVIESRVQLTGCLIGRRAKIGRESVLKDCEVQDGNVVPEETDAKNEKFMIFEGLDDEEEDDMDVSEEFDDNQDEGF